MKMSADLMAILPTLVIMITGMVVLLGDSCMKAWKANARALNPVVSVIGILIAAFQNYLLMEGKSSATVFAGAVVVDPFSLACNWILLLTAVLAIFLSTTYLENHDINLGEYYVLLLFSTSGAMIMASANDLIVLFVAVEILSVAFYVLTGFARTNERSEEAALKYFLLGAFAAGFLLYGIALIYGGSAGAAGTGGTTNLTQLTAFLNLIQGTPPPVMLMAGIALLFVGLGFKAGLVPFHMWTPDVYEGAPTPVTAYMAASAKVAAFAVILRICVALQPIADFWLIAIQVLAVVTMFGGNLLALTQENVKRMLAYSSIAHAGYLMVAVSAVIGGGGKAFAEGIGALMFYLFAYAIMTLGSFGVLIWLSKRGHDCETMSDLKGLARVDAPAAYVMMIFMLSLGGIPLTMGFMGKWLIFSAILKSGQVGVAICMSIASVIAIGYYLRVIYQMCFLEPDKKTSGAHASTQSGAALTVGAAAVASILFGVMPMFLQSLMRAAANILHP